MAAAGPSATAVAAVIAGAIQALALLLGAAANSAALLTFCRPNRRRRVAVSDRFVVNLLTAGLLTALVLPPLALADLALALTGGVSDSSPAGGVVGLCRVQEAASAVAASLPLLSVLLLAGDQALAVLQPLRYHARLDTPRAAALILTVWVASAVFGVLSALVPSDATASLWRTCRSPEITSSPETRSEAAPSLEPGTRPWSLPGGRTALAASGFALLFALPFAATALMYARISGAARRNSQQQQQQQQQHAHAPPTTTLQPRQRESLVSSIRSRLSNASALGRGRETRAARVSALVVLLALVCWLPFHALALARASAPTETTHALPRWLDACALALLSAGAPLAPALFAFRSRRLRRDVRRLCPLFLAPASSPASSSSLHPRALRPAPRSDAHALPLLSPPPLLQPQHDAAGLLGAADADAAAAAARGPPSPSNTDSLLLLLPNTSRSSFSSGGSTQGTTSTDE